MIFQVSDLVLVFSGYGLSGIGFGFGFFRILVFQVLDLVLVFSGFGFRYF